MKKTHNVKTLLRAGALLAVAVTGGNWAEAQTCSVNWTGNANDGLWSNPSNWDTHKVPGPKSDACIPAYATAGAITPVSVHSLQIGSGGGLIIESRNASTSFSVATSLTNQGLIQLFGVALSAGSIDNMAPYGNINVYNENSSITSPAFSNATSDSTGGGVYVGVGLTLRLAYNPVQLQNGTLSGGNWYVDDTGVLIIPTDISQITVAPSAPAGTVVQIDGRGSIQDTSGNNALATLTSVGSGAILGLGYGAPLVVDQDLTSQGILNVNDGGSGSSLTVKGTFTQASGATTRMFGSLSATSVIVQSGSFLQGNGTIAGSVTNNGTVELQGSMTVTGSYSQGAGAALTEYFGSTLNVISNATLSGALNVTFSPKRPPQHGAKYTALTAGSLSGSFTSHTAGFTLTTNANSITVTRQ